MTQVTLPIYQARIVPALSSLQSTHGYLDRAHLEALAIEANVPLHSIQEVASFFPHYRLEAGAEKTLRICRDMACSMAGSRGIIEALKKQVGNSEVVKVEGVSCLGRCDRAPAACISHAAKGSAQDSHGEQLLAGKSAVQLDKIVGDLIAGRPIAADDDQAWLPDANQWLIDPYKGRSPAYEAVKKAVAARDASLATATEQFVADGATTARAEQFRQMARGRVAVEGVADKQLADAVRKWQTTDGWADALLAEFDEKHADLRGLGGAGIPANQKWADVRDAVRTARKRHADDRAFIVVNGDESEPGTFKDRELLLRYPHLIVEAVIVAGLITEATQGFIYIRHEYHEQIEACRQEIARAESLGLCGQNATALGHAFVVSVFVSPGGYICGEQSALIEAMSDRRAEPRNLPPKLETNGLDDRPTLVSNVETFGWVPYILVKGGADYASKGANGWKGRRLFSVSGDVTRPGVYEVPMGMTLRELIEGQDHCRGMKGGKALKAFAPSGPSGGFLPAKLTVERGLPKRLATNATWMALAQRRGFDVSATELNILDLELELNVFRALSPTQALGAGLVVYAEGRDMLEQAVNAMEFFRNESCGKCVPCRVGSQKLAGLGNSLLEGSVAESSWETDLLPLVRDLDEVMSLASICGLGRSVPVPLRTVIEFFPQDLKKRLGKTSAALAVAGVGI